MSLYRCTVEQDGDGALRYTAVAIEDDRGNATPLTPPELMMSILPDGTRLHHRTRPPFLAMIPCPYCGAENDRRHGIEEHTYRGLTPRGNPIVGESATITCKDSV